jgi:hypothetical protein
MRFNLHEVQSCSEIPACRGPEVLFILIQVDPISGKKSQQYPDACPKEYRERVEKFCRNYIWRKITGDITIEFLEAAVERMFNADEVSSVVDLPKLKELKHRIVNLFLYANDAHTKSLELIRGCLLPATRLRLPRSSVLWLSFWIQTSKGC